MKLLQAVRNEAARIAAHVEDSKLFTHMGDRGTFREAIISNFLRPFLPECYGLSGGEIFSSDGEQSAQVDIVIYDALFSTVLFRDAEKMLFPAESVFGLIEIKSELDSRDLEVAIDNILSLKRLPRASSDMMDLLPFLRLNVGDGLSYTADKLNPYLGFVFGYHGISADLVMSELNRRLIENQSRKQDLPDFVFVLDPGYMVFRVHAEKGGASVRSPGMEFSQFSYINTNADTLPLFYICLNLCLGQIRLRSIDFPLLWKQLFGEVKARPAS
jgi:hypothetical protein